jgi:hypothetical protein
MKYSIKCSVFNPDKSVNSIFSQNGFCAGKPEFGGVLLVETAMRTPLFSESYARIELAKISRGYAGRN